MCIKWGLQISMGLRLANIYVIEICKYLCDWGLQISIGLRFANIYGIKVCKYLSDWGVQISLGLRFANIYGIENCKYPSDWGVQISMGLRCADRWMVGWGGGWGAGVVPVVERPPPATGPRIWFRDFISRQNFYETETPPPATGPRIWFQEFFSRQNFYERSPHPILTLFSIPIFFIPRFLANFLRLKYFETVPCTPARSSLQLRLFF